MFERYTEKARRIIFFARYEASQLASAYIETEHLLLGLLQEDRELARRVLKTGEVIDAVRSQLRERRGDHPTSTSVDLPLSHESKRVLAYGAEEAERMQIQAITPGHLLLGMLREQSSVAAKVLGEHGVRLAEVREMILHPPTAAPAPAVPARPEVREPITQPTREQLLQLLDQIPECRWHLVSRLLRAMRDDTLSAAFAGSSGSFSFSEAGGRKSSSSSSPAHEPLMSRFSERARRTIFFARYESAMFGSPVIETEHLLLGLLREDKALANRFLHSHAVVEAIRKQIESEAPVREKVSVSLDMPLSEESKAVTEFAAEESEALGHKHVGTEHLLLGLLRQPQTLAARILAERGLELETVRNELRRG